MINFEYCSSLYREEFICINDIFLKNCNLNTCCDKTYSNMKMNCCWTNTTCKTHWELFHIYSILPYPTWEKGNYLLKCRHFQWNHVCNKIRNILISKYGKCTFMVIRIGEASWSYCFDPKICWRVKWWSGLIIVWNHSSM